MNTLPAHQDPNFHIDEDAAEASARLIEEGRLGEVQHGEQFQEQGCFALKHAALQAHSDYLLTHGIDSAQREQNCNGYFSRLAAGRG